MDRSRELPLGTPLKVGVGGFVIDFDREALFDSQGTAVELRPQAFRVLSYLALNAGRLVTKEELFGAVWPDTVVTDDSMVQAIGDVRHALGDADRRMIKTIPRRGYILVGAEVVRESAAPRPAQGISLRLAATGTLVVVLVAMGAWYGMDQLRVAPVDPVVREEPSIAVLAFTAPQSDADGEALARDVASELASELARDSGLRVISSQSSFQFAGTQAPLAEIAKRLRCRYLVDGKVRRAGEQLRIAVDLIDSQGGQIVWSSVQLADRTTLAATQEELVHHIAGKLQVSVAKVGHGHALAHPPNTLDVYVLMARGRTRMLQYSPDGIREGRHFFEQALAIDPDYALAWVYLGITNNIDVGLGLTGEWDKSRLPEVLWQIRRAIALRPDLPSAHAALSQSLTLSGDHDAALAAAQRCCSLGPNSLDCFFSLGKAQLAQGQVEPATLNLEHALDRNPLGPAAYWAYYATGLWATRRLEESIRAADQCLAMAPNFSPCRSDRIAALVELGRVDEAREEATRLDAALPKHAAWRFAIGPFIDSESTAALRQRRIAAARAAGLQSGALPPTASNHK